jgi:FMN-dependent oxidoreductase (nitrilotriacetate monooxygenase family)
MKQMRLNAFLMNTVGHVSPGMWTHPRDRSTDYNSLAHWTGLARTLERGCLDGLFLADVLGPYDVFGGTPDAALRHATQIPVGDPMLLVPAMAAATEHLGFGVTSSLSYEPPYLLARRLSTLDHLTGGRIGWNVVTSYLDSAARAMGQPRQVAHDARYAIAEEYMQLVYKLWEASWEDGAVLADRARGLYAEPSRVHAVHHHGEHFRLDAIHPCEPSPQRTPVLYQAGSSPAGLGFAARHAECVFMSAPSARVIGPRVSALRQLAVEAGRQPDDLLVFALMTVVLGRTDADAEAKLADYRRHVSTEGALVLMSGWTGVDFSGLDPDQPVRYVENDAGRAAMENFTRADPTRSWTVGEVAEHAAIGGVGPLAVGSPATVADFLLDWMAGTGVDGFNLASVVLPETFEDVVALLVPELQRRGAFKRAYAPGTLREKLSGGGPRLPAQHPARRQTS